MRFSGRIHAPRGGTAGLVAAVMVLAVVAPHHGDTPSALADTAPAAATTASTPLSTGAASSQAKASGKPVLATSMTTSTREVTANPNGSFTMTISPVPVRVERKGTWVALDATLHANPNGTISPAAVPGALVLSGGGSGALATMTSGSQQLSVTLPTNLPKPTISGDSATYANVLPGTDLVVTATDQGGFSDVYVVHTPTAAHDPRLAGLLKAHLAGSKGLNLHTDAAGNLTATNSSGAGVFTAPAAAAWDSATTNTPLQNATTTGHAAPGLMIPTSTHTPLASTVASPGRYAHQANLGASLSNGTLTLSAPAALTSAPAADYPLYLDPAYGPAIANFASVNSAFPNQSYINGAGDQGYMQVGYNGDLEGCDPCFNARSFVTLNMSGLPTGAKNISAQVNFWDSWSASCTAEELDLWTTGPISTSGSNPTTWNHQPTWNTQIGSQTVSKGWLNGCSSGGIGYDISSAVTSVANAHGPTLTLGLRIPASQESNNDDNWKQLNGSNSNQTKTTASVTYDITPNTPAGLYTSPVTNCSAKTPTILGDTGVTLYAPVSTSTGANLTTTFDFYKTTAPTVNLLTSANGIASATYTGASGKPAVMVLPETFIKTQSGTSPTTFAWTAKTSDGTLSSAVSTACTLEVDTSRPGAPGITPTAQANLPTGAATCPLVPNDATQPVETSCAFDLTPPNGTTISGYTYQVNNTQPVQVSATGATTITVKMPGMVNTLTVSALSAGGNAGSSATVWFDGTAFNPPETDGDLDADHLPDLIVPGNTTGAFPPGLWLAQGQSNGAVDSYAQNIGVNGLGLNTTSTAGDWNDAQAVTGNFCGQGTQDALAYFPGNYDPTTNPNGGGGAIVCGTGTTQPLQVPASGNQYTIGQNSFSYTPDGNTFYNATTIANGGNENDIDFGSTLGLMYGIVPTGDGSALLDVFAMTSPNIAGGSLPLTGLTTPTGGTDWNNWTITTAQDTRGGISQTDMYLWNPTTGTLYLWTGLALNSTSFDQATSITYTQTQIATNWNKGAALTLRAADIGGNGNPGLWATNTATGQTTAYVPPVALAANPTLATTATTLTTADHSWQFTDMPADGSGDAITTTADGNGTMPLNNGSTGSVTWNTGDQFSPDAQFTGSGDLQTTTNPINLTQSFTVSLWTKTNSVNGVTLSESGTAYPGLAIYPTTSGWRFYLAADNGTADWTGDKITGGNVDLGVWTHLQATYNATTKVMSLYVDDALVAASTHAPATSTATGPLVLGADLNLTLGNWYTGQIADAETWSGTALAPNQPSSEASYHQSINPERILDTRQTTTNPDSHIVQNGAPIGANSTLTVPIVGDAVTPMTTGAPTTIPASATAVAVDVTLAAETSNGNLTAYADGTQRPLTSSTNYIANTSITGYQIVPIGTDGKIDLYNYSSGTTQVIVDLTGYFTSDSSLPGDQTYHPLAPSYRAVNTNVNDTNTNLPAGTTNVSPGTAFTMNVTGVDQIPTSATAVAVNLTSTNVSGGGYIEAYPTGHTVAADTALSFQAGPTSAASMAADVPLGTGGTITILPQVASTRVIADIFGYYTNDTTGQVYHTVNPTRLVDTRIGVGGKTGAIPSTGTYIMTDTAQITTAASPTLALMVTVTAPTDGGALTAYPDGTTRPGTSNDNWATNQVAANQALIPTGTNGDIDFWNDNAGTIQLVVDCSGYFANDPVQDPPTHVWALNDGSGTTAADTAGSIPLTLQGNSTWTTATVGSNTNTNVLNLDGATGYSATSGPAIDTADSFTVSAWVDLTSTTRNGVIAAQDGTSESGFYLGYFASGKWAMYFMASDAVTPTWQPDALAAATTGWTHIVGVYDAPAKTAQLYVNGTLAATASGITTWNATGAFTVGRDKYNGNPADYFPGQISDVETYDYPLSAAQVDNLYQQLN